MQVLEKILEEIDVTIGRYKEIANMEAVDICYGMKVAKKIIRQHMNDDWIPVDRGLPEEGQEVWVSAKTECVRRGTYTKSFGFGRLEGFICSDGFMRMNTANAWKPYVVPEPYCPERSENDYR